MLADWVVGMLLEDFGITENDVVTMKQVNDACNRENHFNGGIISSVSLALLKKKQISVFHNSWNRTIFGNGKCTNES